MGTNDLTGAKMIVMGQLGLVRTYISGAHIILNLLPPKIKQKSPKLGNAPKNQVRCPQIFEFNSWLIQLVKLYMFCVLLKSSDRNLGS